MDTPDPNAVIIKRLNSLRDEIMSRLERIENELKVLKNDILEEIGRTIYVKGFGNELNKLKKQIEVLVSTLNIIIDSKSYSNNEKIVENAYIIGGHQKWMEERNIVFNLKVLRTYLLEIIFLQ